MDKGRDFFCIRIWGLPELKTYLTDYLRGVFSPINGEFYGDVWNNTPDAGSFKRLKVENGTKVEGNVKDEMDS
eukprot:Nk52_evm1s2100 gene=Nk52_evmTU1s2100